jgi:hypothetical protein
LYKLKQAKKAGKGEKCQSDLFFPKRLISGYLLKAKKPKKSFKKLSKAVKSIKVGKFFYSHQWVWLTGLVSTTVN